MTDLTSTESRWSDERAIEVYEHVFPDDPRPNDEPRRGAIAEEMRQIKAAPTIEDALDVLAWWYEPPPQWIRRAVIRIRRHK